MASDFSKIISSQFVFDDNNFQVFILKRNVCLFILHGSHFAQCFLHISFSHYTFHCRMFNIFFSYILLANAYFSQKILSDAQYLIFVFCLIFDISFQLYNVWLFSYNRSTFIISHLLIYFYICTKKRVINIWKKSSLNCIQRWPSFVDHTLSSRGQQLGGTRRTDRPWQW